jgi:uncharacterized membrane protein YhfC
MDILFFAHLLNGFLMIALPAGLAIYLTWRWKLGGRIWWIGAGTFILSQIGHIPFNIIASRLLNRTGMIAWDPAIQLGFNAVFLGLSAGFFEEGARYLVLRRWAKNARTWHKGVLFGAGHGGAEAIILGILVLYGFIQLAVVRNVDLSTIIQSNQLATARTQINVYWSMPWYAALYGALERLFTIPCQIALAVLVTQVFIRKQIGWLFAAIGYHSLLDGVAVFGQKYLSSLQLEGVIGLFSITSIVIIFLLRTPEPVEINLPADPVLAVRLPEPVQETIENLEKTRYQQP